MLDFKFKKIPTMFVRDPITHKVSPEILPGCEWVRTDSSALITIKIDGMHCKIEKGQDGIPRLYKRIVGYENTNELCYVPCIRKDPADQWLIEAFDRETLPLEGYYECYGPKINNNPQGADGHYLIKISPLGSELIVPKMSTTVKRGISLTVQDFFESVKNELGESEIEGLVFLKESSSLKPISMAKIKRRDFGFSWPIKTKEFDTSKSAEVVHV